MSTFPGFSTPTRIVTGLGASSRVAEQVRGLAARRVVLVGDRGLAQIGMLGRFEELLGADPELSVVSLVLADVNPTVATAEASIAELAAEGVDAVVAVGGGSTQSLAKAIALGLPNQEPLLAFAWGVRPAPRSPLPVIAIPTTAGSGAEVSSTFVLYGDDLASSIAFPGREFEPDIALLDGELLTGLPDEPMRDAALDAYSHAFEALWARGATTFSTAAAFEALRLIRDNLPAALEHREPAVLQRLLEASTLANIACGNAGLGLVHALTSASSIHVPHGRQNGIVLPIVAAFNRPLLSEAVCAEIDRIDDFYDRIGATRRYPVDLLPDDAVDAMCAAAAPSPLRTNNIRPTTDDELRALASAAIETSERVR